VLLINITNLSNDYLQTITLRVHLCASHNRNDAARHMGASLTAETCLFQPSPSLCWFSSYKTSVYDDDDDDECVTLCVCVCRSGVCLQCRVCQHVQFPDSTSSHFTNLSLLAQDLDDLQVRIKAHPSLCSVQHDHCCRT